MLLPTYGHRRGLTPFGLPVGRRDGRGLGARLHAEHHRAVAVLAIRQVEPERALLAERDDDLAVAHRSRGDAQRVWVCLLKGETVRGLAPDPLATPLYWSPFSPVPRRGRPNLLRRFFAPGFMGMGGV